MAVIVEEVGVRIQVLDGHFSHSFVVKLFVLKRPKINEKEAENGQFKKLFNLSFFFQWFLLPKFQYFALFDPCHFYNRKYFSVIRD